MNIKLKRTLIFYSVDFIFLYGDIIVLYNHLYCPFIIISLKNDPTIYLLSFNLVSKIDVVESNIISFKEPNGKIKSTDGRSSTTIRRRGAESLVNLSLGPFHDKVFKKDLAKFGRKQI